MRCSVICFSCMILAHWLIRNAFYDIRKHCTTYPWLWPALQVGDFGLSRIKRNTLVSGGVRGTLPWMAPELLNGSSSRVSEKVYELGIKPSIFYYWVYLLNQNKLCPKQCNNKIFWIPFFDRLMFSHLVWQCGRFWLVRNHMLTCIVVLS